MATLICTGCGAGFASAESGSCVQCSAPLEMHYARAGLAGPAGPGMWRYADLLPVEPGTSIVSMGEGATPTVRSCSIGPSHGVRNLFFKLESCNPTGSFKDRIASLLVTRLAAEGKRTILSLTAGNAGSSVAAYAARAGMRAIVLFVAEAPRSRRLQMHAYGATVLNLDGFEAEPGNLGRVFADMFALARSQRWGLALTCHRYDPVSVEAYKTVAFEICHDLGGLTPGCVYVPVGSGGLFGGISKGFREYLARGRSTRMPCLVAVQPEGASPVSAGLRQEKEDALAIRPRSAIAGVTSAYTSDGRLVIRGLRQTGGHCSCPADSETYEAQRRLASEEGIFAEPAGAIAVAGLLRDVREGRIDRGETIVCVITGSGFKEQETADRLFMRDPIPQIRFDEIPRLVDLAAVRS